MTMTKRDRPKAAGPGSEITTETLLPSSEESQTLATRRVSDDDAADDGAKDDDADGVPYDRGWAWMVVVGSLVNYILISAYTKSSGVFFVELLHHFQAPVSRTALLFAIRGGVLSIAGMVIMNAVIGRLGCRGTALIGAILMTLSAILSSLANELILLICLQAVLLGVADSMLGSSGEVLTAMYFRRRRALVMGIVKTGASIGSVCYPPLLTHLISKYGLRGALLLTGAISLHSLPASLLLRPVSFYRARAARKSRVATKAPTAPNLSNASVPHDFTRILHEPDRTSSQINIDSREEHTSAQTNAEGNSTSGDMNSGGRSETRRSYTGDQLPRKHVNPGNQCATEGYNSEDKSILVHSENALAAMECTIESKFFSENMNAENRFPTTDSNTTDQPSSRDFKKNVICSARHISTGRGFKHSDMYSGRSSTPELAHTECKHPLENQEGVKKSVTGHKDDKRAKNECKSDNRCQAGSNHSDSKLPIGTIKEERQSLTADTSTSESIDLRSPRSSQRWGRVMKSVLGVLDFSLFRRPSFSFFFLYFMLSPTVNVAVDYLPALAEQQGLSKARAGQLLSVIGGLDLVSRFTTGLVANLAIVPVPVMAASALLVLGVVCQCTRFLTSFPLLMVLAVSQGVLAGVVNCVMSMLILHVVGLARMAKGIGFQYLAEGGFLAVFHPVLGYIRDTTGSYVAVYHAIGCCLLAAALILLCEETVRRREERQGKQPVEDADSQSAV